MAYMNQEKKAKLDPAVRSVLKKFKLKGTLSVRNHSTIVLTISAGEIDFIENFINTERNPYGRMNKSAVEYLRRDNCMDVNPYWYHEHFSGVAKDCLEELYSALYSADWYDRSDIMTDYFDTAYYVDIHIGKWNKPYRVTGQVLAEAA